jgi:hypothetical protein
MLIDVITLTKPERVQVCPAMGIFPFVYAGVTPQEAMYDYAKLAEAVRKYHSDFMPDTVAGTRCGPIRRLHPFDWCNCG